MNKYLRMFGLIALLCFSFYYTEQIGNFMKTKDPIYASIEAVVEDYKVNSVNAVINEDTMIPGLSGKTVNLEKSFQQMKNYGFFLESKLVFDEVKPSISIESHKEKTITSGNALKQAVALIVEDEMTASFLEEMGVPYAFLTTKENASFQRTHGIKINVDEKNYDAVEKEIKQSKEESLYCVVLEKNICEKKKKQKITPSLILNRSNFTAEYRRVLSGSIVYLQKNIEISHLKLLMESIYFQGLQVLSLKDLLSESRL